MPGSGARKIEWSEVPPQILEQLVRQRHREHGLVNRAPIILGAAAGHRNADIGGKLNQQRLSVRRWRQRWTAASETVAAVAGAHGNRQPRPKCWPTSVLLTKVYRAPKNP